MNRVQIKFIEEALEQIDRLDDWQGAFIIDLKAKYDKNCDYQLSEMQNKKLNEIQRLLN